MSNKPAKTFRDGAVGLSVWERQGKKGAFYDFTLSRSYKNGDKGNAYASTFREDNAEAIRRLVNDAAVWIRQTVAMASPSHGVNGRRVADTAAAEES